MVKPAAVAGTRIENAPVATSIAPTPNDPAAPENLKAVTALVPVIPPLATRAEATSAETVRPAGSGSRTVGSFVRSDCQLKTPLMTPVLPAVADSDHAGNEKCWNVFEGGIQVGRVPPFASGRLTRVGPAGTGKLTSAVVVT